MLLIYGLALAQMTIFVGVAYCMARAFGLATRVIGLGLPAVVRVRRANPELRIGPLPSASIEYAGDAVIDGKRLLYRDLSRVKRVALVLAPWGVVLGISIACIGIEPALRSFVRGFEQVALTVDLTPLVQRMIDIANDAPVSVTTGILFAKLAATNLLPFGGLAGGMLIAELAAPKGRETPHAVTRYIAITFFAWMLWALGRLIYAATQIL
jgi:hypothetical protein